MQNEPNFRKNQMNITNNITKDYGHWTLGGAGKTNPKRTQTKPISKPLPSPICLFRLLINRICYLYGPAISFYSAKMAQYTSNCNLKNAGRKKYNFLKYKRLSSPDHLSPPTGTLFAYLNRWIFLYTDYTQ